MRSCLRWTLFLAFLLLFASNYHGTHAHRAVVTNGNARHPIHWTKPKSSLPKHQGYRGPLSPPLSSRSSGDAQAQCRSDKETPITIMISLDGFRPEYLSRGLTPFLQSLIDEGFFTETLPQFPSYTFPNHFSLVTGRSIDNQGIVNNHFFDPQFQEFFSYTNLTSVLMPQWWLAEPIWNTVQEYGLKSGVVFWAGSETAIGYGPFQKPTYTVEFNGSWSEIQRFDQLLRWIDYDEAHRPTFLGCYINLVDTVGHDYGTHGKPITAALQQVDLSIGYLIDQLKFRGIYDKVNLVIVSDHGMVDTSPSKYIYLEDAGVELDDCFSFDIGAVAFLRPRVKQNVTNIYNALQAYAAQYGHFKVYYKEAIPKYLNYGKSDRVAPIVIVCDLSYFFTTRHDDWAPRGLHGYVPEDRNMHSILIYKGPALSEQAKHLKKALYSNLDVYPFVCRLMHFAGLEGEGSQALIHALIKPDYLRTSLQPIPAEEYISVSEVTTGNEPGWLTATDNHDLLDMAKPLSV